VEPWAARLQTGCLNDDARLLVAAAAAEYLALFDAIDRHNEAMSALESAVEQADAEDEGSRMRIKVAALRLKSCPGEVEVRAKLIPLVVQLIGKAQTANRGEADAAIVQLRQFAAKRERLMEDFGPKSKAAKPSKATPKESV
jgi:hypothetical protein